MIVIIVEIFEWNMSQLLFIKYFIKFYELKVFYYKIFYIKQIEKYLFYKLFYAK